MTDQRVAYLKKRLHGISIFMWIITLFLFFVALTDVLTAINKLSNSHNISEAYEQSPALLLGVGARKILLSIALVSLSSIISSISKSGLPFTRSIYRRLRIMAIIVICCSVTPMLTSSITGFFDSYATFNLTINSQDIFFVIYGIIIGVISEIFYYGYELQEDINSIA